MEWCRKGENRGREGSGLLYEDGVMEDTEYIMLAIILSRVNAIIDKFLYYAMI